MKVLLDYEVLGIPDKDQMILDVFIHIKSEILKAVEVFDEKYNSVYTVVSISGEGLKLYYLCVNTSLADEFNDKLGKQLDFSKIAEEMLVVKNN